MDYKKKLRIRLITAFAMLGIGIAMMVAGYYTNSNEVVSALGLAWTVMGLARIKKHFWLTKNEERFHKHEIAEKDERNVKIWTEARSLTFAAYMILASLVIVVLYIMNLQTYGLLLAVNLLTIIVIYWICCFITIKKY